MIHDRITGTVVPGHGRGKKLGFPTANLQLSHGQIQPPTGVFAGLVRIAQASPFRARPQRGDVGRTPEQLPAAIHIGSAPTFNDDEYRVEIHILDYKGGDLYDQQLTIELVKKLREIKKFATEDELKAAITADCAEAREVLKA